MDLIFRSSAFLIPVAALAYAVATLGIKMASDAMSAMAVALMIGGFGIAVAAETYLLRTAPLGALYLMIMATETVLVLGLATVIGEGLSARQMAGAGFLLCGMMLVGE